MSGALHGTTGSSSGTVVGPASSTDNAIVRWDTASGTLIQNSGAILTDAGALSGITQFDVDNVRIDGNTISSTNANGNITLSPTTLIAATEMTLTTPLAVTSGGTAIATYATADILTATAANTISKLAKPTFSGSYLIYDGSDIVWFDPSKHYIIHDDFISGNSLETTGWQAASTGGATFSVNTTANVDHPGMFEFNAGTTGVSGSYIRLGGIASGENNFVLGGGEITMIWVVKLSTLSNGTDTYSISFGLTTTYTAFVLPPSGVYFFYNDTGALPNWYRATVAGGAPTLTDTTVAATTNWMQFKTVINAAGTSIEYFIDGTSVGSNTLTIPTANISPAAILLRTAGTAQRTVSFDAFSMFQKLTTPR